EEAWGGAAGKRCEQRAASMASARILPAAPAGRRGVPSELVEAHAPHQQASASTTHPAGGLEEHTRSPYGLAGGVVNARAPQRSARCRRRQNYRSNSATAMYTGVRISTASAA